MPPPTRLVRFVEAMSLVYGPLTHLTPATAASWTPPANPGAGGHRGRYLWTDAFGVLNLITLHRETSDVVYLAAARRLVETVHDVLGRQRGDGNDDDNDNTKKPDRLPGATDAEPLAGGLRIGKREATGPDGDGQYHHYLTLWMFALNRLALAVGDDDGGAGARYNELAVQLARAIHPHFVLRGDRDDSLRMVWKVSTDLRAVLVPSEGHLDAATGYVVYRLLQEAAVHRFGGEKQTAAAAPLEREIQDYRRLMSREGKLTASGDALDLGMGLWMCHFLRGAEDWARRLGDESLRRAGPVLRGLAARDAAHRLAFREFGACLGVECYGSDGAEGVDGAALASLVGSVVGFWEKYLEASTDEDLRPISLVMYAAALIPGAFKDGYLDEEGAGTRESG